MQSRQKYKNTKNSGQSHENSNILKYKDNFSEHQFVNICDFTGLRFLCDGPAKNSITFDKRLKIRYPLFNALFAVNQALSVCWGPQC
jgi:hypothetical protein